jgi:hypothetical protein
VAAALASLACAVAGAALLTAGVRPADDEAADPAAAAASSGAPSSPGPPVQASPPSSSLPPAPSVPPSPAAAPSPSGLPPSEPRLLTIPQIGVRTSLMSLGLQRDGSPEVPPLGARVPAGWLRALRTPGEIGTAVILGHVDSAADGPAVFYRLGQLRPGDAVLVDRADGRRARFVVTSVERVAKVEFPAASVYGPSDVPALRLITCGGTFDHAHGHYRDNVIVYATADAPGGGR